MASAMSIFKMIDANLRTRQAPGMDSDRKKPGMFPWDFRVCEKTEAFYLLGYGSSLVHRFRKDGKYLATINGTEGSAGKFACPHGIAFDYRHGRPELYVTDRSNARVQVYDAEGKFLRAFGQGFLPAPCAFAYRPGSKQLVIPDLFGRVTEVHVLEGIHADRDQATGLTLLFKSDAVPRTEATRLH